MTNPKPKFAPRWSRREMLARMARATGLAALPATATALYGCGSRPAPVRVGILHSQTGTMAISEISLRDAELLAIEEINAGGGVLGRQLEPIVEDGRSRFDDVFPMKAAKLLVEDKVAVVFGCWTSASRKAVLPVFEQHNGLLFYPLQYEGNESSRNIVYTGASPNQQILPAIDWLLSTAGGNRSRLFLIGSDYVFPRTANFIIGKHLKAEGRAAVVGERYIPLGHRDFKAIVQEIVNAKPDVIFSTINGDSNLAFYDELAAQGITADQLPVVATSIGEDELRGLLPDRVTGHLAAWTYFQSLDTPANREFIARFREQHGPDRVLDDPIEAAYTQVYLWKLAVEKAGSFEVDRVRAAFRADIEFDAPGGRVRIDPKTQHTYKRFRLGKIRADRQFDIIHESPEWIEPAPYPQVAFPGWRCDWTQGGITQGPEVQIEQGR